MKLYPYQEMAVEHAVNALFDRGNSLIVAATGAGKTIMLAAAIGRFFNGFYAKHGRKPHTLVLVHRTEIHDQNHTKFSNVVPQLATSELTADRKSLHGYVHFGMVQTVNNLLKEFDKVSFDLVVIDECFTGETLIDGKPIKNIKVGDSVLSYNHTTGKTEQKKVIHKFKSKPKSLMGIVVNDKILKCTNNHPFWVEGKGYIPANQIKVGDYVVSMHCLQATNTIKRFQQKPNKTQTLQIQKNRQNILLFKLWENIRSCNKFFNNCKNKQNLRFRAHEKKQPYVQTRNTAQGFTYTNGYEPQTKNTRRQWPWYDKATGNIMQRIKDCFAGIRCKNERARANFKIFTVSLQNRFSNTKAHDSNRSRRSEPRQFESSKLRPKERSLFNIQRVESVAFYKQTSDGTFAGLCEDGYVYNLEVEGNNNYFAQGVLVHNCHHAPAETYKNIVNWNLEKNSGAALLGVTATPNRADKLPLVDLCDNFYQITFEFLFNAHYLVRPTMIDLSLVFEIKRKTKQGFTVKKEKGKLNKNLKEKKPAIKKMIDDYLNNKLPGKTVIFAPSHAFCKLVFKELESRGHKPAYLYSNIDDMTRYNELKRFETGDAEELINVDICTEGYDYPQLRNLVEFDTNGSHTQWVQKVGRVLRTAQGKTQCKVLDFGGNITLYPDGVETNVNLNGAFKKEKGEKLSNDDFFKTDEEKEAPIIEMIKQESEEFTPYHLPPGFETVNDQKSGIVFVACGKSKDVIVIKQGELWAVYTTDKADIKQAHTGDFDSCIRNGMAALENHILSDDLPITRVQISLLAPEYPTATLTKSGANCCICWKTWKDEVLNYDK